MPQAIIAEKTTQEDFRRAAMPLAIDLQEYFKLLESEVMSIIEKADSMTEDELDKAIVDLIGE
jgi:hypothetical protein